MIAVTGAGGKTGQAVVRALAQRGVAVRALIHKATYRDRVAQAGGVECVVGSIAERATLDQLLADVTALYHICPNMHPDEVEIGTTILQSALAAGVQHFVYHSVLHPQTREMPHHWHKLLVEEAIFAAGLPFTILQPTAYMQNLLAYWPLIRQEGHFVLPYPPQTALSLVHLDDVAEAAARVLTEPGHVGAIYEIVGTLPLTQHEAAARFSAHLGRAVTVAEIGVEEWERQARRQGLPEYATQTLVKMFRYYAAYGLAGNPRVLTWLLGRTPISLDEFVVENVAEQSRDL